MFKMKPLTGLVALSLFTGVTLAATPGGSLLVNKVTAIYTDAGGTSYTAESNELQISIREVRESTLTITAGENQQVAAIPSTKVYSVHTLTNSGNVAETYALSAVNETTGDTIDGSSVKVYLDTNTNGQLDAGEAEAPSIELAAGDAAKLIVETVVPTAVTASDTLKVTLTATDSKGALAANPNTVNITFTGTNINYTPVVWQQSAGGNCHAYAYITTHLNWDAAKAAAEGQIYNGKLGHLVTLASAAENAFIVSIVPKHEIWLGGKKINNTWTWVTGEPWSFTKWAGNRPDNSGGNQIYLELDNLYTPGQWDDAGERNDFGYIVEFDTDCGQPNISVTLEGAKDLNCDGAAEESFGTIKLADMYKNECAILRTRATNTGNAVAEGVELTYTIPQYANYVTGSLQYNGAAKTDSSDSDEGSYDAAANQVKFNAGNVNAGANSPDALFRVQMQ